MKDMENKKYQLPKEFGEKWIAALRSGEYDIYTPSVIATMVDRKYYLDGLIKNAELTKSVLNEYLQKGGNSVGNKASADWLTENVELI